MLDWMSAINAHIHVRYLAEWHIETDFWDRGNVESSFWKVRAWLERGWCCLRYLSVGEAVGAITLVVTTVGVAWTI
jgi:hypothetical protein